MKDTFKKITKSQSQVNQLRRKKLRTQFWERKTEEIEPDPPSVASPELEFLFGLWSCQQCFQTKRTVRILLFNDMKLPFVNSTFVYVQGSFKSVVVRNVWHVKRHIFLCNFMLSDNMTPSPLLMSKVLLNLLWWEMSGM